MKTRKSIEERGGIVVESLEDIAHECFADKARAIFDGILVAVALQSTHLAVVEQNGNTVFAGLRLAMEFLDCFHL